MRVGIVTYALDRPLAGIGRAARGLIEALDATDGIDVVPLTPYADGPFQGPGWESWRLRGCRLLPALMTLGNVAVLNAARRADLDIVHDPTSVSPFFIRPGWGDRGRVLTIHDVVPFLFPETHTALNNFLYKRWLPLTLGNVDALIVPSEATKRDVERYLKVPAEKLHVTPWGVDLRFRPVPESEVAPVLRRYSIDAPYIFYVGSIEPRKNLGVLLRAFARLRPSRPDLQLVIGGRPAWKHEAFFAEAAQLELEDSVRFTGFVADSDLPPLYAGAVATVYPSLYEGFGLPVLESLACGTPVVCSDTAALTEVGGDACLYIPPADETGFVTALQRLLDDAALRATLREKGLERAARFTWQETARATVAVYEGVRAGRR